MAIGGVAAVTGVLGALLQFEPVAVAALDLASDYLSTRSKGRDKITKEDIARIKAKSVALDDVMAGLRKSLDDLGDAIKDKVAREGD